jgi:periplasmic protein CpxP/Spy
MMKASGLILVILSSSIISFAQVERKPAPAKQADSVAGNQVAAGADKASRKDLMKDLNLTRDQKIKLKEIRENGKAKKEAIENNSQLTEPEKKTRLRELQKEQAKSIQAILTDEQKEKFKAKRREAMQEDNL